jgi:hypothetical protein
MLQAYIANVSAVSDVCCRSASCCNISRCRKQAHAEAVFGLHLHAHQQAQGAQLHALTHQHAGAQQLLAACGDGRAGETVACGTTVACGAGLAACVAGETGAAGGASAGIRTGASVQMFRH